MRHLGNLYLTETEDDRILYVSGVKAGPRDRDAKFDSGLYFATKPTITVE